MALSVPRVFCYSLFHLDFFRRLNPLLRLKSWNPLRKIHRGIALGIVLSNLFRLVRFLDLLRRLLCRLPGLCLNCRLRLLDFRVLLYSLDLLGIQLPGSGGIRSDSCADLGQGGCNRRVPRFLPRLCIRLVSCFAIAALLKKILIILNVDIRNGV